MKFAIQINSSPHQSQSGLVAYRFINAAISQGHQIFRVFFYQDGIYHAFKYTTLPDDETNLTVLWTDLAKNHQIDLVICIAAAQRRGLLHSDEADRQGKQDSDLAEGFRISGLGQLIEASLIADRLIIFN